ncbi:MAG TPA: NAD-dependent epimerase/dehydratase family protein, partial [Acidimicrobiales bacterium]|nr:NAD-dependent epimerase/dehydratase family protein [Acidimicrobiales bacterium]
EVLGVDRLSSYYDRDRKLANVRALCANERFTFVESDLCFMDLPKVVRDRDVVFHLAAQPGVRSSWGSEFAVYVEDNIRATQHLLEACRGTDVRRFVFASSSSIYGTPESFPTREHDATHPHSPYGVTKLAAENLCSLYAANWQLPTTSLRYFTVYGPRQRPDMAMSRLISCARSGEPFTLFGDGTAVRDFTYVGDVVRANLLAAQADVAPGTVVNIGGGGGYTVKDAIGIVERVVGQAVNVNRLPASPGDVPKTGADISRAATLLDWKPETSLESGIEQQAAWQMSNATS